MAENQFDYEAHAAWCRKSRAEAVAKIASASPKDAAHLKKIVEAMDLMILECEEAAGNA